MKRSVLRSKLAKIIHELDVIIGSQAEQTPGLAVVKKCRDDIQKVLIKLNTRGKTVDRSEVILRICRLVDCVHFFIFGKGR